MHLKPASVQCHQAMQALRVSVIEAAYAAPNSCYGSTRLGKKKNHKFLELFLNYYLINDRQKQTPNPT
jgi:hypothetical protein